MDVDYEFVSVAELVLDTPEAAPKPVWAPDGQRAQPPCVHIVVIVRLYYGWCVPICRILPVVKPSSEESGDCSKMSGTRLECSSCSYQWIMDGVCRILANPIDRYRQGSAGPSSLLCTLGGARAEFLPWSLPSPRSRATAEDVWHTSWLADGSSEVRRWLGGPRRGRPHGGVQGAARWVTFRLRHPCFRLSCPCARPIMHQDRAVST